jgi:DNA-binding NarL/FixJ family response regulator
MFREALRVILETAGYAVVADCADGTRAVRMSRELRPDVAILDVQMSVLGGIEACREILRHCPTCRVLMLSEAEDKATVRKAIAAGATGYCGKSATSHQMLDALRIVAAGSFVLIPEVPGVLELWERKADVPVAVSGLSQRELQVMRLISDGSSSKEVAVALNLGLLTVRSYRKTLMKKLGLHNVAQLTRMAAELEVTAD